MARVEFVRPVSIYQSQNMSNSMLLTVTIPGSDFCKAVSFPPETRPALHIFIYLRVGKLSVHVPEAICPNYPSHVQCASQTQCPNTLLAESPFKARYRATYRSGTFLSLTSTLIIPTTGRPHPTWLPLNPK